MTFARIRALAIVGVLVIAALVLTTMAIIRDRQTHRPAEAACSAAEIPADMRLLEPKDIKLNVYNATDKAGLAERVANDFKARKFIVDPAQARNDPLGRAVTGVGVVRFGPKAVGAAWVVRANLLNDATLEFDIKRADDVVDVVLGPGYKQLGTFTEVNQALAAAGPAKLPPGTCDSGLR